MCLRCQCRGYVNRRRDVVLLVVLALLTLFAAVGIAFVLLSEQELNSSLWALDAQSESRPQPDLLWGYALNQLVFDTNNPESALRTHSLVLSMFGPEGNTPFNGIGRRHRGPNDPPDPILGIEDPYYFPNFQGRTFDPLIHGSVCAPYTYPDWNNAYLGAINSQGVVLARSFVRASANGWNPYDASSPLYDMFWARSFGPYGMDMGQKRALVTRPIPADSERCVPGRFPMPADAGGDVKNLPPGKMVRLPDGRLWSGNDSYWMDLGFPDQVGADGKRYRPLFAFFITDLDGRVNLNVHGNIRGDGNQHVSNMGLGPWEVNLEKVLAGNGNSPTGETANLFLGVGDQPPWQMMGRYGREANDKTPGCTSIAPAGLSPVFPSQPPFYSRIDLDGCKDFNPDFPKPKSEPFVLPSEPAGKDFGFARFPLFDRNGLSLGYPLEPGERANEQAFHPTNYSPFAPGSRNRSLSAWNLEALLRHGGTGTDALCSDLRQLLPTAMNDPAIRRMVTTHSCDVDRPGLIPFVTGDKPIALARLNQYPYSVLVGGPTPFPTGAPPGPPDVSGFTAAWQSGWSSNVSPSGQGGGRLDLNRPLPDYPAVDRLTGRIRPEDHVAYLAALHARQDLITDIYKNLCYAAGGPDPFPSDAPKIPLLERNTQRYLKQLAANIVDLRDNDDYMTWYEEPAMSMAEQVFGTELPRLVLNEVYAEYTPPEPGKSTRVNVWIELYNPMSEDAGLRADYFKGTPIQLSPGTPRGGAARLQMRPDPSGPGSLALQERLLEEFPNDAVYREELGYTHYYYLMQFYSLTNRQADAAKSLSKYQELMRQKTPQTRRPPNPSSGGSSSVSGVP